MTSNVAAKQEIPELNEETSKNMLETHEKRHSKKQNSQRLPNKVSNELINAAIADEEEGDAAIFIYLFRGKYVYDHSTAQWYYWNDHYWRLDKINQALVSTEDVIEVYWIERENVRVALEAAEKRKDSEAVKKHEKKIGILTKRMKSLHKLYYKKNVLALAASGVGALGITGEEWDRKPMLLAVKNGCVDLTTGKLHPGKPSDYIKTVAPVEWKGLEEQCTTWIEFLHSTFNGEDKIVEYMQRLLGYGITGHSNEPIYPVLWGEHGRNGKTTILETLKLVLGDLAYKAPSDFLMQKSISKGNGGHDAEMMALRGVRITWCSETNKGDKINASRLKELTGNDTISARPPYGKRQIQFPATHLILLITNRRPQMPADDAALWKRTHLIPFQLSFVDRPKKSYERKRDKALPEKLKKEMAGILAWLVKGCIEYQQNKEGVNPPETITVATAKYRKAEDIIQSFLDENYVNDPEGKEKRSEIYRFYGEWCDENGHRRLNKKHFFEDMTRRFGQPDKKDGHVMFFGLTLTSVERRN